MELVQCLMSAWQIAQSCQTLFWDQTHDASQIHPFGERIYPLEFHLWLVKDVSWRMLTPLCFWVPCVYLTTKSFTFQNEQVSSRAGQHRSKVRGLFLCVCDSPKSLGSLLLLYLKEWPNAPPSGRAEKIWNGTKIYNWYKFFSPALVSLFSKGHAGWF